MLYMDFWHLAGNAVMFVSSVTLVAVGFTKSAKSAVSLHTGQVMVSALANICFGAWTGVFLNLLSIARNIFVLKNIYTKTVMCLFMGLIGLCGVLFSADPNPARWLAVSGNVIYTGFVGGCEVHVKGALAVCIACWAVYDFGNANYVGFLTDVCVFISAVFGCIRAMLSAKSKEV